MIDYIGEGEGGGGGDTKLNLHLPKQKSHHKVPKTEKLRYNTKSPLIRILEIDSKRNRKVQTICAWRIGHREKQEIQR